MPVFNSLGSNYTLFSALRILCAFPSQRKRRKLITYLADRYDGAAFLTYKGRDALSLALTSIGLTNTSVAFNGLTCYVVYEAIVNAAYQPCFLDISEDSLNFSPEILAAAFEKYPIRVVVVQNTLGYPCDIRAIKALCVQRRALLIEDIAHCVGTRYPSGEEAGTVGDFAVLSFGQDKSLDGVAGGALIVRNPDYRNRIAQPKEHVGRYRQAKDRLYLLMTVVTRTTYSLGIGIVLRALYSAYARRYRRHAAGPALSKKAPLMYDMPNSYCANILKRFRTLERDISRRREVAHIYADGFAKEILLEKDATYVDRAMNLRFPIVVTDRDRLVEYLATKSVHVRDIWYTAPLAPKEMLRFSSYRGECPVAQNVADRIVNLPTHGGITPRIAHSIVKMVKDWRAKEHWNR